MHVAKLGVQGTSLVGLYIFPLEDVVLVGPEVPEKDHKLLEEIFGAPVVVCTIAGTGLIGVFAATNGKTLVVPHLIFAHEEKVLQEAGISYTKITTTLTCLGNNLLATTKGVLYNPEFEPDAVNQIKEAFSLPIKPYSLLDMNTIGSFLVCSQTHGMGSHEFTDGELDELEKFLGVTLSTGTVNLGSTQLRSGLAVNSKGFIIGEASGGPEIINADEAFGFLGDE